MTNGFCKIVHGLAEGKAVSSRGQLDSFQLTFPVYARRVVNHRHDVKCHALNCLLISLDRDHADVGIGSLGGHVDLQFAIGLAEG